MNRNSKFVNRNSPKTSFWALAPMANITTYPFSSQCVKFGADLVWTPMVHTDTIIHNWKEAEEILNFREIKNYVIQLVGSEPSKFAKAIKIIEKNGLMPVYFDINAGCPDKNIVKSGCGGALLKTPETIVDIVKSAKKSTKIPISVKTRAGYDNSTDIYELIPKLFKTGASMITVHPRTVKQAYRGVADWMIIKKIKEDNQGAMIVGSGDIKGWQEAISRQKETNCDGIMIGRGALGRPWIFREIKKKKNVIVSTKKIKSLILDLAEKADQIWGNNGITEARKHFAWYLKSVPGGKKLRAELVRTKSLAEVRKHLSEK